MNQEKKFKNTILTLIMIILSFLIIFLLHDISKAAIGLLCGGKLVFNYGFTVVEANYSNLYHIINIVLGISIPVLFLFMLVLIFNNSLRNGLYHKFTLVFFMCSLLTISVFLIFYPLVSLFTNLRLHTELDELLSLSRLSPLIILLLSLIITTLLVKIAVKKNLFKNL